jgi:tryptophan synthase alpha chain
MKRLAAAFERRKVLIAYLCVGDPSIDESVDLARACIHCGADIVELGVPFSDPTADGPAIARASRRAIAAGGGLAETLRAATALRASEQDAGIVLFGYYNPLFVRGEARAAGEAAAAGADALLVVDLPIEESEALRAAASAHHIGVIPLLAPTSRPDRIAAVRQAAARSPLPFLYYVSLTGVTGAGVDGSAPPSPERGLQLAAAREAGERAAALRDATGIPVVVGFGIDSREKARAVARGADGAVVGTALVRAIEDGKTAADRRRAVEKIVRELRAGVDDAGRSADA